jgi:MYXO-CTERM domain-containing protein
VTSPTRPLVALSVVVLATLAAARAHAAPGCLVGGVCRPDVLEIATLRPCDARCETGYCVDGRCLEPMACEVPCSTDATCPTLRLGNQELAPATIPGPCAYRVPGCFGDVPISFGSMVALASCFATGAGLGASGLLEGDCDGDGVLNRAEGQGQICTVQGYLGAPMGMVTELTGCGIGAECLSSCTPTDLLHGGLSCGGSRPAIAYTCDSVEACPSTSERRALECLDTRFGSICLYRPLCADRLECFDFERLPAGIEAAYAGGDCDRDGILNEVDRFDCGTIGVVDWDLGEPTPQPGETDECASADVCGSEACDPQGLCIDEGIVGIACNPLERFACGTAADCAPLEGDVGFGVCVDARFDRTGCSELGSACFVREGTLEERFQNGDCDADGIVNAREAPGRLCLVDDVDAGSFDAGSFDAGSFDAGSFDAGSFDAGSFDAGSFDAGSFDAGSFDVGPAPTQPSFAGSGCRCRAGAPGARGPAAAWALAILGLGAVLRRRSGAFRR